MVVFVSGFWFSGGTIRGGLRGCVDGVFLVLVFDSGYSDRSGLDIGEKLFLDGGFGVVFGLGGDALVVFRFGYFGRVWGTVVVGAF